MIFVLRTCRVLDYSVLETSARNLFQRTTLYIKAPLKDSVCIVFAAASLFCTILEHIHGDPEKNLTEVLENLISIIRNWINKKIIGIKMFGYDETAPRRSNKVFPKGSDELEVSYFNPYHVDFSYRSFVF